jgi:hypothetical protein
VCFFDCLMSPSVILRQSRQRQFLISSEFIDPGGLLSVTITTDYNKPPQTVVLSAAAHGEDKEPRVGLGTPGELGTPPLGTGGYTAGSACGGASPSSRL